VKRNAIVGRLLREMAEEVPTVLRALPDDRIWEAMVAGVLADDDAEAVSARIAHIRGEGENGAADWREVYRMLRAMVNEWQATIDWRDPTPPTYDA